MLLLTVFASLAFATEEIKRARLEVGMIQFSAVLIANCFLVLADLWWMTIEFSSEGEAIHQRSPSRIVSFNVLYILYLSIIYVFVHFFFAILACMHAWLQSGHGTAWFASCDRCVCVGGGGGGGVG